MFARGSQKSEHIIKIIFIVMIKINLILFQDAGSKAFGSLTAR
jgi:hypothetical protein